MLAVIFAVSSAFTSTQLLEDYQVYSVASKALAGDESAPSAVDPQDVRDLGAFIDDDAAPQNLFAGQFQNLCDPDPDFVCLAQIKESESIVHSIREGAYNQ